MENIPIEILKNLSIVELAWIIIANLLFVTAVQLSKMIRDWLVGKSVNKLLSDRMDSIELRIEAIDIRTEHNSFIPSFASEIEDYKESILATFKFRDEDIQLITTEIIERIIDIFINIMKRGYSQYNQKTLDQTFRMYELKLEGMINIQDIELDVIKVLQIIQIEKESFFIDIKPILPKRNGDRQESYIKLCKRVIKLITKKMSAL